LKLLVDEDTKAGILLSRLRQAGHDVVSTQDLGKDAALDPEVFELAQRLGRVVLTKNTEDYFDLHEKHKAKGHFGVLAVYEDADPDKDMSYKDIVQALANIEGADVVLANNFQTLNAWNWKLAPAPSKGYKDV